MSAVRKYNETDGLHKKETWGALKVNSPDAEHTGVSGDFACLF